MFSIIIPTYNNFEYFKLCLKSIKKNSFFNSHEIVAHVNEGIDGTYDFIKKNNIKNVVELGCGDGANLKLYKFTNYVGYDVSSTIIKANKKKFNDKNYQFELIKNIDQNKKFELSLSLDVLYHLTEKFVFEEYLDTLFNISSKYVIIYSSNFDSYDNINAHVRHRNFEYKVPNSFKLINQIPNDFPSKGIHDPTGKTSVSEFFIYQKI